MPCDFGVKKRNERKNLHRRERVKKVRVGVRDVHLVYFVPIHRNTATGRNCTSDHTIVGDNLIALRYTSKQLNRNVILPTPELAISTVQYRYRYPILDDPNTLTHTPPSNGSPHLTLSQAQQHHRTSPQHAQNRPHQRPSHGGVAGRTQKACRIQCPAINPKESTFKRSIMAFSELRRLRSREDPKRNQKK